MFLLVVVGSKVSATARSTPETDFSQSSLLQSKIALECQENPENDTLVAVFSLLFLNFRGVLKIKLFLPFSFSK
jgi:hypothetical protein